MPEQSEPHQQNRVTIAKIRNDMTIEKRKEGYKDVSETSYKE